LIRSFASSWVIAFSSSPTRPANKGGTAKRIVPVGSSGSQELSKVKKSMKRRSHFLPSRANICSSTLLVK